MSHAFQLPESNSSQGIEFPGRDASRSAVPVPTHPAASGRGERHALRLGIADDHAIVREGLKEMFSALPDITVVGEASDGREAIELVRRVEMDVLLMDLAMPNQGGVDALGKLHERFPRLRVLILSGFPEEQYAPTMLRLGAAGYLAKDSAPDELIDAVRTVGSGKRYSSTKFNSMLAHRLTDDRPCELHETLTAREFQVFLRLAQGQTIREIGRSLALSFKTVSTYRTSLTRKLSFNSDSELTYYAIKHGLIE